MVSICIGIIVLMSGFLEISGFKWDVLLVKYSNSLNDSYIKMPVTRSEVTRQHPMKFVKAFHDNHLNVDAYSHPDDPRFFLLYDSYGDVAGVRTGYIKSDVAREATRNNMKFPYEYDKIPLYDSGTFWGKEVWYASILFLHPEKLKAGGRKCTDGEVAEGVFVRLDNRWLQVPRNESEVEELGFVKQTCIKGMGEHYYYKVTRDSECETIQPFFCLYYQGKLQGFGMIPFGSYSYKEGGQKWFEDVPREHAEVFLPNAPQCAYDWIYYFDASSLHFYFRDGARYTECSSESDIYKKYVY